MVLFSTTHWFQLPCSSSSRILNLEKIFINSLPTFLLALSKMCHIPPLKRKKGYLKFMKLFQHINYDWQNELYNIHFSYWWFQELTTLIFIHTLSLLSNLEKSVVIFFYKLIVIIFSSKLFLSLLLHDIPHFWHHLPFYWLFLYPSPDGQFSGSCWGEWNYVVDRVFAIGLLNEFSMKLEEYDELKFPNLLILLKLRYTLPVMPIECKRNLSAVRRLSTRMRHYNWKIRFIHDNEDTFKMKIEL